MLAGSEIWWTTGTTNYKPYVDMRTAEAYMALQDWPAAREWLDSASDQLQLSSENWCKAELYRLEGAYARLALQNTRLAADYYQCATDDAKSRGAQLWIAKTQQSIDVLRSGDNRQPRPH